MHTPGVPEPVLTGGDDADEEEEEEEEEGEGEGRALWLVVGAGVCDERVALSSYPSTPQHAPARHTNPASTAEGQALFIGRKTFR